MTFFWLLFNFVFAIAVTPLLILHVALTYEAVQAVNVPRLFRHGLQAGLFLVGFILSVGRLMT